MADYSIVGKRFGKLVVLGLDRVEKHRTYWLCQCDCGVKKSVLRGGLTSGDIVSCGCYHREHNREFGFKHGLTNHPLYNVWAGIKERCLNCNASNYNRYGGRGIGICEEWKTDFKSFYDWAIANGYETGLTIDRINNNGDYTPNNCRIADRKTQQNNTRRNKNITYNGITHTLTEWSRILNVNHETLRCRVSKGNMQDFEKFFSNFIGEV